MNRHAPILIGGGGHARSLTAMAPPELRPRFYVDPADTASLVRLGDDDTFLADTRYADDPVIVTFVAPPSCSMLPRRRIIERYSRRRFATIVADDAVVEHDTVLGAGTMIFHRAVVNTGVFLGDHVIVNTGAIIEHDTSVGTNTFIGPGAIIAGGASIGSDVYIGAGAIIRNGISVADGAVVGMGAVVVSSILEPGVYAGNPARLL